MRAVGDRWYRLEAQARDNLGNKRLSGGDALVAQLRGSCPVEAAVKDSGDGRYTATFCATSAGDHLIHVTMGTGPSPSLHHLPDHLPALKAVIDIQPMRALITETRYFFAKNADRCWWTQSVAAPGWACTLLWPTIGSPPLPNRLCSATWQACGNSSFKADMSHSSFLHSSSYAY